MSFKVSINMKYTIAAMLIVLFVSIATLVLLNKKPICMNSKIINKIERTSQNGSFVAYQCSLSKSVPFDEKLLQKIPEISRRLYDLERFFEDVAPLKTSVEINWLDNSKSALRIQEGKIFISDDLLNKENILESSLLRIWIRENSPQFNLDRTLLESGFIDLILYSLGKLKQNPASEYHWPSNLKTAMAACQSKEMPADLLPLCSSSDYSSESIFLGSVRPMISYSLLGAFSKLTMLESHELVKRLPILLKFLSTIPTTGLLASEETLFDQVSKVELEVSKITSLLEQSVHALADKNSELHDQWLHFIELFLNEMKSRGWNIQNQLTVNPGSIKLENLFVFEKGMNLNPDFLLRIKENQNKTEMNGVVFEGKLWFSNSQNSIPLSAISQLGAYKIMYVSCERPSSEKMLSLLSHADKVLVVKKCNSSDNLNVRGYLQSGYREFAKENPSLQFYQIHSPSVYQVMKKQIEIPFEKFEKSDWNHPFFTSVGWGTPEWHARGKFFESHSVIQAVQAFRL